MPPENNNNLNPLVQPSADVSSAVPTTESINPSPVESQNPVVSSTPQQDIAPSSSVKASAPPSLITDTPEADNTQEDSPSPLTQPTVTPAGASPPAKKSQKSWFKFVILGLVLLIILVAVAFGAYTYGKGKAKTITTASSTTTAAKPINLPPEAVVTSECTPGRGKQYIIPKDIPAGPIYDVKNSKVIAVEYVIGIKSLFTNSDDFSSKILTLTKNYPVDHLSVVPGIPKPGDTDQYIHLIMFVVSKDEANSITCGTSSTTSPQSTSQPTPTTSKQ